MKTVGEIRLRWAAFWAVFAVLLVAVAAVWPLWLFFALAAVDGVLLVGAVLSSERGIW